MASGYWAVWFLFKDQPFDVARFYRPDGSWTGYYVDVLQPVHWEADDPGTLHPIVDLFLDIWIARDGSFVVLDEDEFDEAVRRRHLSVGQAEAARVTLDMLRTGILRGDFPPTIVKSFVQK